MGSQFGARYQNPGEVESKVKTGLTQELIGFWK